MSVWRDSRNAVARQRFERACPAVFPLAVLLHARAKPLHPVLPSLAVASYWAHHPVRADRLARALAAFTGPPSGWRWRIAAGRREGLPQDFRTPPAPYREAAFDRGPGSCCICGQPVFRFGWHRDLWGDARRARGRWHGCCVAAWKLWTAPVTQIAVLKRLQSRRCAATNRRLGRSSEVDHAVPLFAVWRDRRDEPWPDLLGYWGMPNLEVVDAAAHGRKTAAEASARASLRQRQRGQVAAAVLTMGDA